MDGGVAPAAWLLAWKSAGAVMVFCGGD